MAEYDKRYLIRRAQKKIYDDVMFVSERSMRDILAEEMRKSERRYNEHLNSITNNNESLTHNLRNKNQDYDKLNSELQNLKWRYEALEQEKKSLEKRLEAEATKAIHLRREVNNLSYAKSSLQEHIDKIQSEHIQEIRKIVEKRGSKK